MYCCALFSLLVIMTGCSTTKKLVVIRSKPIGAAIKINDQEVGKTPVPYAFEESGNWFSEPEDFIVEANTPGYDRYVKVFDGENMQFIPSIIFFELTKQNATDEPVVKPAEAAK